MLSFKQFINESPYKKHVGTCITSFDDDTGECINPHLPYVDVTHHALATQDEDDRAELKKDIKIPKEEFLRHAIIDKKHRKIVDKPTTEFAYDKDNDLHMMYDRDDDVHHYYA